MMELAELLKHKKRYSLLLAYLVRLTLVNLKTIIEMDCDKIIAGSLFTGLSLALTPIYVKIIHILLWNTEFRRLRCYQIMVQIGIIDCMFVLGYAVFGVSLPLENDFYGFPFVVVQLLEGVWMTKVSLNVALAINRLTVTCRLTIPAWLHWIKMLYCWLLGLFYFIICLTPYTGLRLDFDSFGWTYNMSKPYTAFMQKVDVCYATGALAFCFLMYLIAALILLLSRMKYSVNNGNHKMELRICVMAVVLFSSPMLGDLLWNFAFEFLPKSHWTNVAIGVFSICNIALAAPTVYLVMNK
ncbi:hypothetical protein L596_017798 [Steinernema carpocapsae]|uniref:G-protein coupled receptors family 1 profile domain-containing protein n=1 Tax=Steinernema carpocapsae TaxID=34508 RepID=A0A4U5N2P0_STECR|nr:hypothetical protein L596_017798 [Steinernema carpocapsae]